MKLKNSTLSACTQVWYVCYGDKKLNIIPWRAPLNVGPTCNSNKWDVAHCQTTHSRCRLRKQALTLLIKTLNSRKWKISAKHRSNTPINPHSGTTCFVGHTLPHIVEKTPVLVWSDLIFLIWLLWAVKWTQTWFNTQIKIPGMFQFIKLT